MLNWILPLRAIALQLLFLVVSVAIEAYVLRQRLGMTPRGAARYSLSLNLFSSVLGWLVVFTIQPLLSQPSLSQWLGNWDVELMSLTLFGHFYSEPAVQALLPIFLLSGLIVLVFAFLSESAFMSILLVIWASIAPAKHRNLSEIQTNRNLRYSISQTSKVRRDALLIGNLISFGVVSVLIFVLSRQQMPS